MAPCTAWGSHKPPETARPQAPGAQWPGCETAEPPALRSPLAWRAASPGPRLQCGGCWPRGNTRLNTRAHPGTDTPWSAQSPPLGRTQSPRGQVCVALPARPAASLKPTPVPHTAPRLATGLTSHTPAPTSPGALGARSSGGPDTPRLRAPPHPRLCSGKNTARQMHPGAPMTHTRPPRACTQHTDNNLHSRR